MLVCSRGLSFELPHSVGGGNDNAGGVSGGGVRRQPGHLLIVEFRPGSEHQGLLCASDRRGAFVERIGNAVCGTSVFAGDLAHVGSALHTWSRLYHLREVFIHPAFAHSARSPCLLRLRAGIRGARSHYARLRIGFGEKIHPSRRKSGSK